MASERAILGVRVRVAAAAVGLLLCAGLAPAKSPTSPVETALEEAGMFDVLEAHLLGRLERSGDEAERLDLIERLSDLYADRLRAEPADSAERSRLRDRAWRLADKAGENHAVELRLTLLLDEYLPIERAAGLHELGLLEEADRSRHAAELNALQARFDRAARSAVVEAAAAERRFRTAPDEATEAVMREAYRVRSLANYYAAWSGLTLAVLEERVPSPDVLRSFGWLVGSAGELPKLDDVREDALELEHVARSVIGIGRAKARSEEWLLAEQWLSLAAESERAAPGVRAQALARLMRAKSDQGEWRQARELALLVREELPGGERAMPTPDARYLALRSLGAIRADRPGASAARPAAELAFESLIARGEIGHVLDLRDRFGAAGLLGDGFAGRYAEGLDRLAEAQEADTAGLYRDAAAMLVEAAEAPDASRFPVQRDDALLKAAFAEVRAGQPRSAMRIAQSVLAGSPAEEAEREARWLLVVAIEETRDDGLRAELAEAVRDYLARYPGTERASRLLVRHAGTDVLEPGVATDGLRAIAEDDPVALAARRVLVRLVYRSWIDSRRADGEARAELLTLLGWIWEREPGSEQPGEPRERLDTARIGLDAALGAAPADTDAAERALRAAEAAVAADRSLARFADELALRRVELDAALGRLEAAAAGADELHRMAVDEAGVADRVVLAAVFDRLDAEPEDEAAAAIGVRLGARVSGDLIPPAPETIPASTSRVLDRIWRLAASHARRTDDDSLAAFALRVGGVVLDRGRPTAQGLRELAELASERGDETTELNAWSTLLGASRDDEDVWWEARYHTLRLLKVQNPQAARAAYEQHRVLHPAGGILPWVLRIEELFADASFESGTDGGVMPDPEAGP